MATIRITPQEIINILIVNGLLQGVNLKIKGNDNDISIRLKISLISVGATIKLLDFKDNVAKVEIQTNKLVENELLRKLKKIEPNQEFISFNPPIVFINLNMLLSQKIQGVKIMDFTYEKGEFTIITQDN